MLEMVVNGTNLILKLLKIPSTQYPYFSVTDSAGQTLAKRVIPLLNEVVLEKEVIEVSLNGTADLNVLDGNGNYTIYKNDENVSVSQTNTTRFTVYGKTIGESVLEVRDSYGKSKSVLVKIITATKPGFGSLFLINKADDNNLKNVIAFNATGSYQEVGVIFKDLSGQYLRQTLEKNADGFYIIQADTSLCTTNCLSSFQPYMKDMNGNYIYPNGAGNYLAFENTNFNNVAITDGGLAMANVNIANLTTINYWKLLPLDPYKKDILDFLLLNILWVGGQTAKNYTISPYLLRRFIYGDGADEFYDTNHFISGEVKQSSWYADKKQEAIDKYNIYANLQVGYTQNIDKSENYNNKENNLKYYKIVDNNNTTRHDDLKYGFGKINWEMSIQRKSDGFYLEIVVYDLYNFEETHIPGMNGLILNTLNSWGEYYQSRGYGKPFNWKLQILEKIY